MIFAVFSDDTRWYHLTLGRGRTTLCGRPTRKSRALDTANRPAAEIMVERPDHTGLTLCVTCAALGKGQTRRSDAAAERRRLDALVDQLPVGVIFCDLEERCTQSNQKVCDIFGIGCNVLLGLTIAEIFARIHAVRLDGNSFDGEDLPATIALRDQRLTEPIEVLVTRPDGGLRRTTFSASPITMNGEALGCVMVIADNTERQLAQEQVQQSQRMESIGILAGGIAHDFNNLLTAILGNTQLALRKMKPGDPIQRHLVEVERASTRAADLTRQLLAFSRRQRLERMSVDLNTVITDTMKMLRRLIGEDIKVVVDESPALQPVFADPAQIEQVIMNLVINARDAMPVGGTLSISTRNVDLDSAYHRDHPYVLPGRYVELVVSDSGVGMSADTRKHIFEPFFTTKEAGKGTGLGLATVYGVVKQHEGSIEVSSETGRGTTFRIYLPVREAPVEERAKVALPVLRGGRETILVAEDEETLRNIARDILHGFGYKVLLARNGEEAVDIYRRREAPIDLLVFDIVMPRLGGREAYDRIREIDGNVPVIFMTGYSEEVVQYRFVKQNNFLEEMGATLLQKPYGVETLGRKVREILDNTDRAAIANR